MLEQFLKSIGCISLPSNSSIFTNDKVIISKLILVVYVNDLLIAREYEKDIVYVKQLLKVQFKVEDLGEVQVFLDIQIRRYSQ